MTGHEIQMREKVDRHPDMIDTQTCYPTFGTYLPILAFSNTYTAPGLIPAIGHHMIRNWTMGH